MKGESGGPEGMCTGRLWAMYAAQNLLGFRKADLHCSSFSPPVLAGVFGCWGVHHPLQSLMHEVSGALLERLFPFVEGLAANLRLLGIILYNSLHRLLYSTEA